MAHEMGKINDGVVSERKRLSDLVKEPNPSTVTRAGREYAFDREILLDVHDRLPALLRVRLKLPLVFYFDSRVADSFLLTDTIAFEALQNLGEISELREFTGGRIWIGRPIVFSIMRAYPTLIQIMVH